MSISRALAFICSSFLFACATSAGLSDDAPAPPPTTKKPPTPTPPPTPPLDCGDKTVCDEACSDLKSDSLNCGQCGRQCNSCLDGACLPEVLGTGNPLSNFAIDETSIYFTSRVPNVSYCLVQRSMKDGASRKTVHDSKVIDYQNCTGALAVDSQNVYWGALSTHGILRAMKKTENDGADLIERDVAAPVSIVSDDAKIYFQDIYGGFDSLPVTLLGAPTLLAPNGTTNSGQLAADATNIYTVAFDPGYTGAKLLQIPKVGGGSQELSAGALMYGLRSDPAGGLAFKTAKVIRSFDVPSKTSKDAATNVSGTGFALDKYDVFWADASTGSIMQLARGTTTPMVLASGFKNTCTKTCDDGWATWPCADDGGVCDAHSIRRLEVDSKYVYFLDDALGTVGYLWRVRRWIDGAN